MKTEYAPSQLDYLRRETVTQAEEIKRLRRELSFERYARLTAEMDAAIARGDQAAWERAFSAREAS